MTQRTEVGWPTCDQAGCIGVRLNSARMCLTHGTEEERAAALKLVGDTGTIDARGAFITPALLEQVLTVTPRGANDQPLVKDGQFDQATFTGDIRFDNVTFNGHTRFDKATFNGEARFDKATFNGNVEFYKATFNRNAKFYRATFNGNAAFGTATFKGDAEFYSATFGGGAWFSRAIFERRAGFEGVMFYQADQFGPLLAYRGLVLDNVQFAQLVRIEASTTGVCCRQARFPGGVQLRLRWARVVLDDADLPSPSTLTGVPPMGDPKWQDREKRIVRAWQRLLTGEISERPQLLSLRRANVAGLGLSNVSVADCRFAGALNLDKLRLESDVSFAIAPLPGGSGGRRWGGREVIAEERDWRVSRAERHGRPHQIWALGRHWVAPGWPRWLDDPRPGVLNPGEIAGLYRALRKGREDAKDEPGAADFYYGEMEMRRHFDRASGPADNSDSVPSRGRVERSILTAYWLVSGYGLRAWRAVACLVVVTALLAAAFHLVGFTRGPEPNTYWTSVLYAFRATLSLTDSQVTLTAWGQLLQAILRLTGPVLLALALLALRGRLKR
jgi:hypothetical protein